MGTGVVWIGIRVGVVRELASVDLELSSVVGDQLL